MLSNSLHQYFTHTTLHDSRQHTVHHCSRLPGIGPHMFYFSVLQLTPLVLKDDFSQHAA
jgi:hypothetical protein